MKRSLIGATLMILAALLLPPHPALASPKGGGGHCGDGQTLTREEAASLLAGMVDNVLNVEESPVRGLWVVDIAKAGRKVPVYVDCSKKFVIGGQMIRIETKEDLTGARAAKLNEVKVDLAGIPLSDALVVGNPDAKKRVVVFSDPDCSFCAKLHGELKTVIEKKPDVAFYVKLYSRSGNPASAAKARSVICAKSMALLDEAYAGKPLPPPACSSEAPEETLKLAGQIGVRGTPAMVLPDGRLIPGYRDANALLKLLEEESAAGSAAGK